MREIVVPREKAVFWLDKNGRWRNQYGEFQHKKVIDYFHSAIRKDNGGYYLFQETDEFREKVYFNHEDTALFIFDVIIADDIQLVLNTRRKFGLVPEKLFIHADNLYVDMGDEVAKFTANSLLKISSIMSDDDGHCVIETTGKRVRIAQKQSNHQPKES